MRFFANARLIVLAFQEISMKKFKKSRRMMILIFQLKFIYSTMCKHDNIV